MTDIHRVFTMLKTVPPSVVLFGGARHKEGSPIYELAREIGRKFGVHGVPVKSGAGPGAMESVVRGQLEAAQLPKTPAPKLTHGVSPAANPDDARTQGINMTLPHEPELNPYIEVGTRTEFLPYRKVGLYENVRGMVAVPGGYGTLDELFEVWARGARGRHNDPMVAVQRDFFKPIFQTLHQVACKDRKLISPREFGLVQLADTSDEVVEEILKAKNVRGFEEDPEVMEARLVEELTRALQTLDKLEPAVTFIGGSRLAADDWTLAAGQQVAKGLAKAGLPVRVGGTDAVARAVSAGVREADPAANAQGFLSFSNQQQVDGLDVLQQVEDSATFGQIISLKSRALVALPGGLGTLDELFSVLTQIQTGNMPSMPVVLVGKEYWQPLFDTIGKQMLGENPCISPEDLKRVIITDDPKEVLSAIKTGQNEREDGWFSALVNKLATKYNLWRSGADGAR